MKILIIRNYPTYMDISHNTYNIQEIGLAKAIVGRGHRCDIVFWTDKEEKDVIIKTKTGGSITVFYRRGKVILKNVIFNNLDVLAEKYDILQSVEYNQFQSCLLARKYPEKTVIYHGPYYDSFNKRYNTLCRLTDWFLIPVYKRCGTLFLTKSDLAKQFLISKGIAASNIDTAGVGIDTENITFCKSDKIPDDLAKIDEYGDKLRLLYIGRIEPRRNIAFLFDILKELLNRGTDAELIMIGSGDREYNEDVFAYAEKIDVADNILHIERAEQKYLEYAYRNTDVFLLPTRYEIFGMVLLEAMYFGKSVITTKNGGSEMLIDSGSDGTILDNFDAAQWCDAIADAQKKREPGKRAAKKIAQNFTWNALSDRFLQMYNRRRGSMCES